MMKKPCRRLPRLQMKSREQGQVQEMVKRLLKLPACPQRRRRRVSIAQLRIGPGHGEAGGGDRPVTQDQRHVQQGPDPIRGSGTRSRISAKKAKAAISVHGRDQPPAPEARLASAGINRERAHRRR